MLPKTKIVATLGPASANEEILRAMLNAGVSVCRVNFSHGCHDEHKRIFDMIKKLRSEMKMPIAILTDLQGPKIRVGTFKNKNEQINLGQKFTFTTRQVEGTAEIASVSYTRLAQDVKKDSRILVNDGLLEFRVVDIKNDGDVECIAVNSGVISDHKGVNIPGIFMNVPFLSDKDKADLNFAIDCGVDFIAASFTQNAANIEAVKKIISERGGTQSVIAKIENQEGLNNVVDILRVADGLMVARGDLGVEVEPALVAFAQKDLIKLANTLSKPVITATQMLESMTHNTRPTRAEVTDITNAILDGTSALMLSGETAAGEYPIETVKMMRRIANTTEKILKYKRFTRQTYKTETGSVTGEIAHAACLISSNLHLKTIITPTTSGLTAQSISRFKPKANILALTDNEAVYRALNLFWGVTPLLIEKYTSTDAMISNSITSAYKHGYVKKGETVVITSGIPCGTAGTTNLVTVKTV